MTTATQDQTLEMTFSKLERALLAPVVSGELKGWIANVQQAAATFAMDWTRQLHTVLHVQYAEIVTTDAELSTFVEKMIGRDQELQEELARFHELLHDLSRRTAEARRDENKVEELRKSVETMGIELIVQIKKQQTAAATWLAEAVYRDRGVVD